MNERQQGSKGHQARRAPMICDRAQSLVAIGRGELHTPTFNTQMHTLPPYTLALAPIAAAVAVALLLRLRFDQMRFLSIRMAAAQRVRLLALVPFFVLFFVVKDIGTCLPLH
mgnify:CR=1 FL=1